MGSTRATLVRDVAAVQAGAAAIDAADVACARGDGVGARSTLRRAAGPADRATAALRGLPGELTAYGRALDALDAARRGLEPVQARVLSTVVTAGRAEVTAGRAFGPGAAAAWPAYARLRRDEATWVTRAVTPWYRSTSEGADAYVVLVSDRRPALARARARLSEAAAALALVLARGQQVLDAADRVLRGS